MMTGQEIRGPWVTFQQVLPKTITCACQFGCQRMCFGSKADIATAHLNVRFTPNSGHWNSAAKCPLCAKSRHSAVGRNRSLFDHRVGAGEQGLGHRQTQRLCCLQVDGEFVLVRSLHRQISRFLAP